jgi:tRNA threonylcarbamoyladenosine biosynthesis protein TsaB
MLLALEQSTASCSLAVLDGDRALVDRRWTESRFRHEAFFPMLESLWKRDGLAPDAFDAIAVGLGPGAYSGLRLSLAAASGLALPGRTPIVGVSSAEALAWDLVREIGCSAITVIGDARRGRLWIATFSDFSRPAVAPDFSLIDAPQLAERLAPEAVVATSDGERLRDALNGIRVRNAVPSARAVGQLARERLAAGTPSPPLVPIYLHPPVFIEPSFGNHPA